MSDIIHNVETHIGTRDIHLNDINGTNDNSVAWTIYLRPYGHYLVSPAWGRFIRDRWQAHCDEADRVRKAAPRV